MKRLVIEPRTAVAAGTAVAVTLVSLFWLFATLSSPAHTDLRLEEIERRLTHARATLDAGVGARRYPTGAVCRDVAQGMTEGRAMIAAAAGEAGVALAEVHVVRSAPDPGPMLGVLTVDLAAKGQEPALTKFLHGLADRQPLIIADAVDLGSDGTDVSLRVKGRFICHDRRLP